MKIISITVDKLPKSCGECMNVGICGLDLFKQGCFAFELKKDFQTSRHPDCPLVEKDKLYICMPPRNGKAYLMNKFKEFLESIEKERDSK